ncbi:tetratricopeptide repeat protein [Actinoplanes sp. HUAS TT8]|uniref:tetratricopeptide repeat protein n=1 Tax=Actinoplanes sp. HUAS TT8 TaxID=3447453 RepID=UPI003F5262EA
MTEVSLTPVVSWPREARSGGSYLISVDVQLADPGRWPYEREEYVVGCVLEGGATFDVTALGSTSLVLHRFGGTYGPVRYLAVAGELPETPSPGSNAVDLRLTLLSEGGLPFRTLHLPVTPSADDTEAAPPHEELFKPPPARPTRPEEPQPREWDFFVSYTQADRAWAEWIAWELEEAGSRVLIQAWDFAPGAQWVQEISNGVARAERLIAVLSDASLSSTYGAAEWQAAFAADPVGADRKLLTVRVEDCARPGLLSAVAGIDLFGVSEATARSRLRTMVEQAVLARAKPSVPPAFPDAGRAMPRDTRFPGALPDVWNVPARNPNFVGRESDLAALAGAMAAEARTTVTTVRGMGGVGKTQLAIEYAHRRATRYDLVWWINADDPAWIPDQFATLALRLGLAPDNAEAVRDEVHRALRQVPGWLLVFDDVDSAESIQEWVPTIPMPPGVPGHVLVTTRRSGFGMLGHVHDLDVVDRPEAVQLIRSRAPHIDEGTAGRIADEVGRLPIALEQAAAYINRTLIPPEEYLTLLATHAQALLSSGRTATLWELSFARVQAVDPAALQLLEICAYLASAPIPLDLFTAHPDCLAEPLNSKVTDPLDFNDLLALVIDHSLASRTPDGLLLHRLVQSALRWRSGEVPPAVMALLRADMSGLSADMPANWPRFAVLLPHVLEVNAGIGDSELVSSGDPESGRPAADFSWILDRTAGYLRSQGRFREALSLAERALTLIETVSGPDDPAVGSRLNTLSSILVDLGEFDRARTMAERALAIVEAVLGPEHPQVSVGLSNVAIVLRELGDIDSARALAERSLEIVEAAFGPDHPEVAIQLGSLALLLSESGEFERAVPLAERSLAIEEAAFGTLHPRTALALNSLSRILRESGEPGRALPLAERELAVEEELFGPAHPRVAVALGNLALTLRELGEPERALPLAERAVTIDEAVFGPDHPEAAPAKNILAMIRRDLVDPD